MIRRAILTDDGTAVKTVDNFDDATVFKAGWAFPVVENPPVIDPKTQSLSVSYPLPVAGVVTAVYTINTLDAATQTAISDRDKAVTALAAIDNFIANFGSLNQTQINNGVLGLARVCRALVKRQL